MAIEALINRCIIKIRCIFVLDIVLVNNWLRVVIAILPFRCYLPGIRTSSLLCEWVSRLGK
jgi:hypothetical protein